MILETFKSTHHLPVSAAVEKVFHVFSFSSPSLPFLPFFSFLPPPLLSVHVLHRFAISSQAMHAHKYNVTIQLSGSSTQLVAHEH